MTYNHFIRGITLNKVLPGVLYGCCKIFTNKGTYLNMRLSRQ